MSIDSLDSDSLIYLLNFLPTKTLFKIESVNKKWQKCVRKLMDRRIIELKISDQLYGNVFKLKEQNEDEFYYVIDDTDIAVIKNILSRCQSVKYLNLKLCRIISTGNNLIEIAKLCPKLERISFKYATIQVPDDEWNEFTKLIGPKLIECNAMLDESPNNLNLLKTLFKEFKKIKKLKFESHENDEELFVFLNSCDLRHLRWNNFVNENLDNDQKMVFERLNYLSCTLYSFTQFNCKMDNLIELEIWSWIDDGEMDFLQYKQMDQIEFPNLKRLTISLCAGELKLISKLNFPNLEHLSVNIYAFVYDHFEDDFPQDKIIFFNLFKNCKEIYFSRYGFSEQLYKFTNLIKLRFDCFCDEESIFKQFEICINHKTIKEIIIDEIGHYNCTEIELLKEIFNRLINMGLAKPKVKILSSFKIHKFNIDNKEYQYQYEKCIQFLDEFKQKFQQYNWNVKLYNEIECELHYIKLNLEK